MADQYQVYDISQKRVVLDLQYGASRYIVKIAQVA